MYQSPIPAASWSFPHHQEGDGSLTNCPYYLGLEQDTEVTFTEGWFIEHHLENTQEVKKSSESLFCSWCFSWVLFPTHQCRYIFYGSRDCKKIYIFIQQLLYVYRVFFFFLHWPTSSIKPHLKASPHAPAGKQVFMCLSLWRIFLIQTQGKVKTFQSFAGRQFTNRFF